jgi:hypothetical protein
MNTCMMFGCMVDKVLLRQKTGSSACRFESSHPAFRPDRYLIHLRDNRFAFSRADCNLN